MNLSISAAPTPLPGKVQPAPKPQLEWVGKDLVKAEFEYGTRRVETFRALGVSTDVRDARAFTDLGSVSFVDAVEAASQLAAQNPLSITGSKDATEQSVSSAIALMQGIDGAWYASALESPSGTTILTVDTGRANVTVHDVQQLHPDVKAVVGAHSWVNFTDDAITPQLAG